MDDQSLHEMAQQGATAASAGVVCRLVVPSRRSDRRLGWNPLWELPAAIGLSKYFHLGPWVTKASGVVITSVGLLAIAEIVRRWAPREGRNSA